MRTLLKAFCIRFFYLVLWLKVDFLKDFCLPSPSLANLPRAGVSIQSGFQLKGSIHILGLKAHADVTISPTAIKYYIVLPSLRIGRGLLHMYASRSDRSRGPFLKVILTILPPKVDIHASGFVSVLGIQQRLC